MSEHYLKPRMINNQETTPKRMFVNQNQSYTQQYFNQSPIYHTPDRAMKQPFRNPNQSYNEISEVFRRYNSNPQFQFQLRYYYNNKVNILLHINLVKFLFNRISTILVNRWINSLKDKIILSLKILVGFNRKQIISVQIFNYIEQKEKEKKINEIHHNPSMIQNQKWWKIEQQKDQLMNYNNHQVTDRNLRLVKFEEKASGSKSDNEKIKQILLDEQMKLKMQIDEFKIKINKQDSKIAELEKQNKQLKTQLSEKSQEVKTLQQSHISQSKLQEIQDQQMKKFQRIYEQLTQQNDDLREENNQLKLLLLQVDNYSSVSRSIISKKNSEQEFQLISQHDTIITIFQLHYNIKEIIDQFLKGISDKLLSITQDSTIQNIFIQFRDIINSLQFNQHQKLDFQMLKDTDFMRMKKQSEDIITVPELNQKADHLIREIKQKMEQMASLKDGDQRKNALKEDIDRLQKEYDGIQILVTEQSDYLDKNAPNLHRNSIISFDQNFDGEEQQ